MKIAIVLMLTIVSLSSCSQKHFALAKDSVHKVEINIDGTALKFDGRTYFIHPKRGWYRNDSIIWIYGHDRKNWKDMVKVGFYNNYKNYVVSIKTEKLP
jgi:hypothetical protein